MTVIVKAKVWLYYLPKLKWYNLRRKLYSTPKFRVGDLVEHKLSYATVVYRVEKIERFERLERLDGSLLYRLVGIKILEHDGTNPYMTETKKYNPFCSFFDKKAKLWEQK